MEILNPHRPPADKLRAAVFDFDGTISTLRQGWEQVMRPLMREYLDPDGKDPAIAARIDRYIDESTGIQTVYQMEWLRKQVTALGKSAEARDVWWYKDEYNRRLMEQVSRRVASLEDGRRNPEDYLIAGSREFIRSLAERQIALYVASGTDDADVVHEVQVLGLMDYFSGIAGTPYRKTDSSKEQVIQNLLEKEHLRGGSLLVVGDGKVEIRLGSEAGARTLGAATDEEQRRGVNPVKRQRLVNAGADAIVGDFEELDEILAWLNLN